MHRVAGARVVEREGEQRVGRQAGAGPAEPDARRRQFPQSSSERDGGAGVFMIGLLGRDRSLAQPDRIVRRVLLAADAARANMIR